MDCEEICSEDAGRNLGEDHRRRVVCFTFAYGLFASIENRNCEIRKSLIAFVVRSPLERSTNRSLHSSLSNSIHCREIETGAIVWYHFLYDLSILVVSNRLLSDKAGKAWLVVATTHFSRWVQWAGRAANLYFTAHAPHRSVAPNSLKGGEGRMRGIHKIIKLSALDSAFGVWCGLQQRMRVVVSSRECDL